MKHLSIPRYEGQKRSFEIQLPSSKSLANRVLILAAQAEGEFVLRGDFEAEDVQLMIDALRNLGIEIRDTEQGLQVKNDLSWKKNSNHLQLFLGNSGTCVRFLSALVPLRSGTTTLAGKQRMTERPIVDLCEALSQVGVDVVFLEKEGYPPHSLQMHEQSQKHLSIAGDVSSQYLTALLLSAPSYPLGMDIALSTALISQPYIALTLDLLDQWRILVHEEKDCYRILPQKIEGRDFLVEGDASAAVYWWAFAFLHGTDVTFTNLDSSTNQGDGRFPEYLRKLSSHDSGLLVLDMNDLPDASLMMMALAPCLSFPLRIENIASLRVKETDRIGAMSTELRKCGVGVDTGEDWIQITPRGSVTSEKHIVIQTYDDHRIAMSFAILSTVLGNITLEDPDCVQKSYPKFWRDLERIRDSS